MNEFGPSGEKSGKGKPEKTATKIDLKRRRFMGDVASVAVGAVVGGVILDKLGVGVATGLGTKERPGTRVDTTKQLAEAAKALERNQSRRKIIGYQKKILEKLHPQEFEDRKRGGLIPGLRTKLAVSDTEMQQYGEQVIEAQNEVQRWVLRVVDYPEFNITADSVKQAIDHRRKVLDDELAGLSP